MRDISAKTRKLIGNYVLLSETKDFWLILSKVDNQVIHLTKSAHHEIFKVLTGGDISKKDTERIINLDCFKRLVSSDEESDTEVKRDRKKIERRNSQFSIQPNVDGLLNGADDEDHEDGDFIDPDFDDSCSSTEGKTKTNKENVGIEYDSGVAENGEPSDDAEESEQYLELSRSPRGSISDLNHMLTNMRNIINFDNEMTYSLVLFNLHRICNLLKSQILQMAKADTQSTEYASFGMSFSYELARAFDYLVEKTPPGNFSVDDIGTDLYSLSEMRDDVEFIFKRNNGHLIEKGSIRITEELHSRIDLIIQKLFNRFPHHPVDDPFHGKCRNMYNKIKKLHEDHWLLVERGVYCQQPNTSLQPKFKHDVEMIRSKLEVMEVDRCPKCNSLLSETEFAVLGDCGHKVCLTCAELCCSKPASKLSSTWNFRCPVCESIVRVWCSSLHLAASRPNFFSRMKPFASLVGVQVLLMAALYVIVQKGMLK